MFPLRPAALLALLALAPAGCAHTDTRGTLPTLRPAAEGFHQAVRWRDFRGAATLLVPELRGEFEQARRAADDARDLHVTDFEIEEARVDADGLSARVVSRVQWYRLPSLTQQDDTVVSDFVFREGRWQLQRQEGGPFAIGGGAAAPAGQGAE